MEISRGWDGSTYKGVSMKIVKIVKPEGKVYGGWVYLWEIKTHIFATEIDREGGHHTQVHALSKKIWTIEVDI